LDEVTKLSDIDDHSPRAALRAHAGFLARASWRVKHSLIPLPANQ
jgi:hypothetical protein